MSSVSLEGVDNVNERHHTKQTAFSKTSSYVLPKRMRYLCDK